MRGNLAKIQSGKTRNTLKIQIGVLLIVALTVVLIAYLHYYHSRNALLSECSSLIQERMLQINADIEFTLTNVLDISKQAYNDTQLYPILKNSGYPQRFDSYNYMMKKLDQIKNSNRSIDSLAFYLENSGKLIYQHYGVTSSTGALGDEFLEWYENDKDVDITVADTHPAVLANTGRNLFSVFARLPIGDSRNAVGALIINIDQSFIYKEIIKPTDTNLLFYIADEGGRIIFSPDENLLYKNLEEISYLRNTSPDDLSHNIVEIDGTPYLVVANQSGTRGWQYIMVYPIDKVYATITNIRIMVSIISIVVLLASSFAIYFMLSFAFSKYDEIFLLIKNKLNTYSNLTITGNIKEDVLRLFSDRDLMREQWDTVLPLFKDKFCLGLVMQNHNRDVILEQMEHFGIAVPKDDLIVSVLEIESGSHDIGVYNDYIENLSVIGVIENTMSEPKSDYFCISVTHKRIVLVTALHIEALLLRLDRIIQQIGQRLSLTLTVGVYDIPCGIEGLNQAYQYALQATPYKIIFGANKIILYSDINRGMQEAYIYPGDKDENLRTLIKVGNQEKAIAILSEMFATLDGQHSYFAIQQFVFRLNASIMEIREALSFSDLQIPVQVNLQNFDSISEVWEYFHTTICMIIGQTKRGSDSRMEDYFRQIVSYIKQNYNSPLSVEQVCSYVKLSPTYVNQILKKYTGGSFVQYLNDYRIGLSCTMLSDPSRKVVDISEQLGFGSAKYFIKLFKDSKGITPGEYRKQF